MIAFGQIFRLPAIMDLENRFPALSDVMKRAKRRVPHFVWEFLDSATGAETTKTRNTDALDRILFAPAVLKGDLDPTLKTTFLDHEYDLPFVIAPVGMSGLIWPGAEQMLARHGADANIPYCLSTVASQLPEDVGPLAGSNGWFQLYPPRDGDMRREILTRVRAAGFHTLVLTLDIPAPSRRERQLRADLTQPLKFTPRLIRQALSRPQWLWRVFKMGIPRLKLVQEYEYKLADQKLDKNLPSNNHVGYRLRCNPDLAYLKQLQTEWDGPIIAKGVMDPDAAVVLASAGVDAIWVSNHGGRQFDAAPASISVLPDIRTAVGPSFPIIFDGGIRTGLDVLRAFAHGANFAMLGRAHHYGLAAFGEKGAAHVSHILSEDMKSAMAQMGINSPSDAVNSLVQKGETSNA